MGRAIVFFSFSFSSKALALARQLIGARPPEKTNKLGFSRAKSAHPLEPHRFHLARVQWRSAEWVYCVRPSGEPTMAAGR